jgi:hypothetical protein
MEQTNQREATYNAVKSTFESNGVAFEDFMDTKGFLTPEMKKEIKTLLFEGFRSGSISYTEKFANTKLNSDKELNKYCGGLVSNWTKKDKRLNGNIKYEIQNPGSRAGHGDDQVKAMRNLKKTTNDPTVLAEIDKALEERIAEVKASKVKNVVIDVQALPEHLRHLVKSE